MNGKEANYLAFIVRHRNHKEVCDVVMKDLDGEALEIANVLVGGVSSDKKILDTVNRLILWADSMGR